MKLETEAGNSMCLFSSPEQQHHQKAVETPPSSSDGAASSLGGCSVGAGERSPSAQVCAPTKRSITDGASPLALTRAASSSLAASTANNTTRVGEREGAQKAAIVSSNTPPGRGSSSSNNQTNGESPDEKNQEGNRKQDENGLLTNGCHEYGGLLSQTTTGNGCLCLNSTKYCFSSLNCEHFKFIDDDDDDDECGDVDANVDSARNASVLDKKNDNSNKDIISPEGTHNGIQTGIIKTSDRNGINGHHSNYHMRENNGHLPGGQGKRQQQYEVSDLEQSSAKTPYDSSGGNCVNGTSKLSAEMCDVESGNATEDPMKSMSNCQQKLRSVLKKCRSFEKAVRKGRVTFDEAVTLYSDDFDDPQMLSLRSAAEVNCPEVFYMFEPPIEYQDLLPFEPPAEYRDPDTGVTSIGNRNDTENVSDINKSLPVVSEHNSVVDSSEVDNTPLSSNITTDVAEETTNADGADLGNSAKEGDIQGDDASVSVEVVAPEETSDNSTGEENDSQFNANNPEDRREEQVVQQNQWNDPVEESERVFQRFLEAEREFAEDDELNRVFHVLEHDLGCDEKDDAFDDNFFKKLIGLLTAAEGDVRVPQGEFFSTTDFSTTSEDDIGRDTEEDDSSQTHSRTLSEADSDCSVSSQDTIIVRMGEDDSSSIGEHQNNNNNREQRHGKLCRQHSESDQSVDAVGTLNSSDEQQKTTVDIGTTETNDEVFNDGQHFEENTPVEQSKEILAKSAIINSEQVSDDTQSSVNSSLTTATPPRETTQDADDSTSSDSRSGEVEEEIRLDDIGYDEEDADDYDEECLRGMVRGNSKIRRIIKKNALQCTLFRSIEARRRQQTGCKPPRPKSPPLSQESLVEQLKWLTTVDDNKDVDPGPNFCSKPPDVILSTGSVPLNGTLPRCSSSESEFSGCPGASSYRLPVHYVAQPRHMMATDGKGTYLVQHSMNYPQPHPSRTQRPWLNPLDQRGQMPQHLSYTGIRQVMHQMPSHIPHGDDRLATASPTPRDYRDWRVIQRVADSREKMNYDPQMAGTFRRCPNGPQNYYPRNVPPGSIKSGDELEQFVMEGNQRMERIRKRYSVAEEDDDPTFGFARRPSVRGVQNRIQYQPSDVPPEAGSKMGPVYATVEAGIPGGSGTLPGRARPAMVNRDMSWCRNANWRPGDQPQGPVYCTPGGVNPSHGPIPVHRASVALSDMSGCATLPHPKAHSDARYHSYAENMYSGSQTLPHKRWQAVDPRTYMIPGNPMAPPPQMARLPPASGLQQQQPALQVPPHSMPGVSSDERGVPEGASSSPKMSSDSLYHGPLPEVMPIGASHKDDGMIYYAMNV